MPEVIHSLDPRTGASAEEVGTETSRTDVDRIVRTAAGAAADLAALGSAGRATLLDTIADELEADREHLVAVADRETALGPDRLHSELTRTTYQLRFFADVVREGSYLEATIDHARETPMGPQPDVRRFLVPLGPVAVFAASNFPFAFSVPGGDTAAAIAAGSPVVVKAHFAHPATSELAFSAMERAVARAGAPEGTIGRVHGFDAGTHLVTHPGITAVAFTGSLSGGRALFDLAARRPEPIPFFGELGSLNPLVVTRLAAAERAAEIGAQWVASSTLGAGQFCTKPGLALIPAGPDGRAVRDAAVDKIQSLDTMWLLNDSIATSYHQGIEKRSALTTVEVHSGPVRSDTAGFAVTPTLIECQASDLHGQDSPLLQECFGPTAVLATYETEDELLGILRRLEGSLTATVHLGKDEQAVPQQLLATLRERAGRLIVNGFPTGVTVNWAMQHGGPWPSTTSQHTSVGATAIRRFLRPVAFQNFPDPLLPPELRESNPHGVPRRVDGELELRADPSIA
jgi:NADP-dependent aldehyde dehydrogenase